MIGDTKGSYTKGSSGFSKPGAGQKNKPSAEPSGFD
jgi:hypothetical protein